MTNDFKCSKCKDTRYVKAEYSSFHIAMNKEHEYVPCSCFGSSSIQSFIQYCLKCDNQANPGEYSALCDGCKAIEELKVLKAKIKIE